MTEKGDVHSNTAPDSLKAIRRLSSLKTKAAPWLRLSPAAGVKGDATDSRNRCRMSEGKKRLMPRVDFR
jgi:hypothetical protein